MRTVQEIEIPRTNDYCGHKSELSLEMNRIKFFDTLRFKHITQSRLKATVDKNLDKYLDPAREIKALGIMKITEISIIVGALATARWTWKRYSMKRRFGDWTEIIQTSVLLKSIWLFRSLRGTAVDQWVLKTGEA